MLYLEVNGRQLLLPQNASAQVEHINPLFADGMEDSFSLPIETPAQGNEKPLGYVHQLPLRNRQKVFNNARLGHAGAPLFPGALHVLSTTPTSVRSTFLIEAFVSRVRGVKLPDTLLEETVQVPLYVIDDHELIQYTNMANYADGGTCRFPMYFNPSLYGSANPDFYPDVGNWSATDSYGVNKLVHFQELTAVERNDIWQCILPTSPGESPITHDTKWRRTSFGIVNSYNVDGGYHYRNATEDSFYTMVPWFYYKWVIKKALAHFGYRAIGDFMADPTTNELVLPNNTTLDVPAPPVPASFFRVRQNAPVYYDPGTYVPPGYALDTLFRMPAQDESSTGYQDPSNVWDNTNFTFSPNAAGSWRFRIRVVMQTFIGGTYRLRLTLRKPVPPYDYSTYYTTYLEVLGGTTPVGVFDFAFNFSLAEVGETFYFTTDCLQLDPFEHAWPRYSWDTHSEVDILGYLETPPPVITYTESLIHAHRHVPEVEVLDFLIAIADAFNLELVPNDTEKTLRMDYKETALDLPTGVTDHSSRQVDDIEIDHQRAIPGVKLEWDMDDIKDTTDGDLTRYNSELDIPLPASSGLIALSLATRQLYKSVALPASGVYTYEKDGYLVPPVVVGDPIEPRVIRPALVPLHMVHAKLDLRDHLMPVLDELGTSDWFHTDGRSTKIHICEYKTGTPNGSLEPVPAARTWGYGWDNDDRSNMTLLWDQPEELPGLFQHRWRKWLQFLTTAEPVTMDLLVDSVFMRGNAWRRIMHIHGQNYLPERVPIDYNGDLGPLISRGAFLYRLMPTSIASGAVALPSFVCAGPGYGSFEATETTVVVATSTTGWQTRRSVFGQLTPAPNYHYVYQIGSYCFYSSNADGDAEGELLTLVYGEVGAQVDVRGYTSLTSLFVVSATLLDLDVSQNILLEYLQAEFPGTALNVSTLTALETLAVMFNGTSIDLSQQGALLNLHLNFQGDTPDLSALVLLQALFLTGPVLTLYLPNNPHLGYVSISTPMVTLDLAAQPLMRTLVLDAPNLQYVMLHYLARLTGITCIGTGSLNAFTVDALCNALDLTVTGGYAINLQVPGNAAPTIDSQPTRDAWVANGNYIYTN